MTPLFHWSKIPLKANKIVLLCALGICSQVNWLCSRHRFLSSLLSLSLTRSNAEFCHVKWWCVINIRWWRIIRQDLYLEIIQGCFITRHTVGGGGPFILMKTAQQCFKEEKLSYWATSQLWKYLDRCPSPLTSGLSSNYDSEMSHFAGVVTLKRIFPWFYRNWVSCHFLFCYNWFRRIRDTKHNNVTLQIKITARYLHLKNLCSPAYLGGKAA